MLVIKVVAAAVLGAVLGAILFVVAGYPLFLAAAGGRDMNGGIAMGMVTGIGPLGAIVGAIAGVLIVLARHSRKPDDESKGRPKGRGGHITIGVIIASILSYMALLLYLQGPAKIRLADNPDINVEIRTSAASIAQNGDFKPNGDLFDHYTKKVVPVPMTLSVNGEAALFTGSYRVGENMQRMRLRVHLSPTLTLNATVPVLPGQELVPGYSGWSAVDSMDNPKTGKLELAFAQKTHMYRYQVIRRDQK